MKFLIKLILLFGVLTLSTLYANDANSKNSGLAAKTLIEKSRRYNESEDLKLAYDRAQLEHHIRVYKAQYYQTILIAVVVHIMIGFGLYLSYLQFKRDEKFEHDQKEADDNVKADNTEFKITKESISVSSNVIGLVILVISFLFYYVYIESVYTIHINYSPA